MLYVYEIEQLFYQSEPDVDGPVSVFLSVCLSVYIFFTEVFMMWVGAYLGKRMSRPGIF